MSYGIVLGGLLGACAGEDTGVGAGAAGSSAGTSAAGAAADGGSGSLDPVDLTLGGMNQDLPAPAVDCTTLEGNSVRCLAFTAEVEGERLTYVCMGSEIASGTGQVRGIGCTGSMNGASWSMGLSIGPAAIAAVPGTFEVDASPAAPVDYEAVGLQYANVPGDVARSNFVALRLRGFITRVVPELSMQEVEQITGAFAASWSAPDPSDVACAPDAFGNHCAAIRVRGTFKANLY